MINNFGFIILLCTEDKYKFKEESYGLFVNIYIHDLHPLNTPKVLLRIVKKASLQLFYGLSEFIFYTGFYSKKISCVFSEKENMLI